MSFKHKEHTDKELKDLVVKVYDNKIFTSFHCEVDMVMSVFMPMMFIMSPPSPPMEPELRNGKDIKEKRKNKLVNINDREQWEKDMKHYNDVTLPEWKKNELPLIEEFVDDIGMIYESLDQAGPRSINGYPMFFSCKHLNRKDSKRFGELYNKYKEKRERFDNEF